MKLLQGKSARVRVYLLCIRVVGLLHSGHLAVVATIFNPKEIKLSEEELLDELTVEIWSTFSPSSFGSNEVAS